MIFELQAFCAGDLTGREQLTVKVDHDQNETFVYSMEVQKHCVVLHIFLLFVMHYTSDVIVLFYFHDFFLTW